MEIPAAPAPTPATLPATVLVDCTAVLAGGANGGAKVLVMELLPALAALAPATRYVVLTRRSAHQELATLDCANLRRIQVLDDAPGDAGAAPVRRRPPRWTGLPGIRRLFGFALVMRRLARRRAARRALGGIRADLLFCPFTAPTYHLPELATVCTIHDLQYLALPAHFTPAERALRDDAFREACRRATVLIAVSEFTRQQAIDAEPSIAGRIRTVLTRTAARIGADGGNEALLHTLDLGAGRYFLYPANFWPHKNHARLLEAFLQASRHGLAGDFRLVFTGGGEQQEPLRALAGQLGLGARVVFAGFVPDADLAELMRNAGALVFPSLHEGFGMPILEAMALGTPVLCSGTTALPEVAAGAALLFDPESVDEIARGLLAVTEDPALRTRLIATGHARARAFGDGQAMAREYLAAFASALGTSATRQAGARKPGGNRI